MKVKMTMKVGDKITVIDENQSKMFSENNNGLEQLLEAKGGISMLTSMIDASQPEEAGKRIEIILEFDDGQYIVVGRKPKGDFDDGR